jgi:hypothetical protein
MDGAGVVKCNGKRLDHRSGDQVNIHHISSCFNGGKQVPVDGKLPIFSEKRLGGCVFLPQATRSTGSWFEILRYSGDQTCDQKKPENR